MQSPTTVVIDTPIAKVILHKASGYLEQITHPKKNDNREEMRIDMDACVKLLHEHDRIPVLADSRQVKGITKEVREYITERDKIEQTTSKLAVVVSSGISKIGGNLFLKFSNLPYPIKLFTDKEKALEWLLS